MTSTTVQMSASVVEKGTHLMLTINDADNDGFFLSVHKDGRVTFQALLNAEALSLEDLFALIATRREAHHA